MQNHRAPIILEGQVYLDEARNSYLVVTKRRGEVVSYAGPAQGKQLSFKGLLEDETFIDTFQPVDPADLTASEAAQLRELCQVELKVGFIKED